MRYRVVFTPEAQEQLLTLYNYISEVSILGIFYGGQDHESLLRDDQE